MRQTRRVPAPMVRSHMTLRLRLVLALVVLAAVGLAVFGFATYALYSRSEYRPARRPADAPSAPIVGHELATARRARRASHGGLDPTATRRRGPGTAVRRRAAPDRHVRRAARPDRQASRSRLPATAPTSTSRPNVARVDTAVGRPAHDRLDRGGRRLGQWRVLRVRRADGPTGGRHRRRRRPAHRGRELAAPAPAHRGDRRGSRCCSAGAPAPG